MMTRLLSAQYSAGRRDMFDFKTILVPVDFGPSSFAAFDAAKIIAAKFGAKILVLHVIPPPVVYSDFAPVLPENGEVRNAAIPSSELGKFAREDGGPIERLVCEGDEELMIIHEAAAQHCDLIVMGTAGRTGIGRLLLGSVAEHVSRQAPCPVLLVKAPQVVGSAETPNESQAAVRA